MKAPGVSETEIKQVDRRYAANTMQQVWDAIADIRNDPEETLIAVIEEHPAITILTPNAGVKAAAEGSPATEGSEP